MTFFPKLLLLSLLLWLPSLTSFPARVQPHHILDHVLHFSHTLRHKTTVHPIPSAPNDANDANVKLRSSLVRQGVNGDPCEFLTDCEMYHHCVTVLTDDDLYEPCKPGTFGCVCLDLRALCSTDSDCDDGQLCSNFQASAVHICTSEQTAPTVDGSDIDSADTEDPVPEPTESGSQSDAPAFDENGPGLNAQGLNGDFCSSNAECQGDRQCIIASGTGLFELCTTEDILCYCFTRDAACSSISDCDDGELCVEVPEGDLKICFSEQLISAFDDEAGNTEPVPTGTDVEPSDTDECDSAADCESGEECVDTGGSLQCIPAPTEVPDESPSSEMTDESSDTEAQSVSSTICIAAHHLSELSPDEMMYPKHILARVFCDKHNNCGTPGHIVKYKGRPMMMSSYCGIEPCSERISEVNSPKYVRHKLVTSNSGDLVFTTLAARYNSRVEEAVLSLAFRMGL